MKIALIDCNPKPRRYNIGLLRIGTMLKNRGHVCSLHSNQLPSFGVDEMWFSTQFTFNIPNTLSLIQKAKMFCDKIKVGGTAASLLPEQFNGLDIHCGIIPEADECIPDYSLLGKLPRYSVTATSRGCIRKCGFCMVHRLEPRFYDKPNWYKDIHRASVQIDFYDNNWLAKPIPLLERDSQKMRALCASGRITRIDFSQALDCRLVTPQKAELMEGLPIKPVRFAFDNMSEDGHFQSAIELCSKKGFKKFAVYILWNFNDTPRDLYYRLKETHRLSQAFNIQVMAFPMRFQPILEVDSKREHTGKNWTSKTKKAFAASLMYVGKGQISLFGIKYGSTPVENFEYWYGRTPQEFVDILNMPDIRKYWRRKKLDKPIKSWYNVFTLEV